MPETDLLHRPAFEDAPLYRASRTSTIEPNGAESIVTINGAVFVALSLDQAQAVVARLRDPD